MSAAARVRFPWLPPVGAVWNVEAGTHWDVVHVSRHLGLPVVEELGDSCGAVIQDSWTSILYWLVPAKSTTGWNVPQTVASSETTYLTVPSLAANPNGLHWLVAPSADRLLTDPASLRAALLSAIHAALGPREGAAS